MRLHRLDTGRRRGRRLAVRLRCRLRLRRGRLGVLRLAGLLRGLLLRGLLLRRTLPVRLRRLLVLLRRLSPLRLLRSPYVLARRGGEVVALQGRALRLLLVAATSVRRTAWGRCHVSSSGLTD